MTIETLLERCQKALHVAGLSDKRRVKLSVPTHPSNGVQVCVTVSKTLSNAVVHSALRTAGLVSYTYPSGVIYVRLGDNRG